VYVDWRIENNDESMNSNEVALYGPTHSYVFSQVGSYRVGLMIVTTEWHYDEAEITVNVMPTTSDTTAPNAVISVAPGSMVDFGTPVTFDGMNSSDDVEVVNRTWIIQDVLEKTFYGPIVTYTFERTGNQQVTLIARDASGNAAMTGMGVQVNPTMPDNQWPNATISELPRFVRIGDTVSLDASSSGDNGPIAAFTWYIRLNNTLTTRTGAQTSFVATSFGMYDITLAVRDSAGNVGIAEGGILSLTPGMDEPSAIGWTSTPLGQDLPFNVLTFAYGAALLASVIFIGGLFSKGFAHEVQKGTARTIFFAPISVTNMLLSKILYPVVLGPLFIFPLMLISTLPLEQDINDIVVITLVAYIMTVVLLISAVYGSCMIFAAAKRMVIKPSALARAFMYL
jgi:hypothetical protein